MYKLYYPYPATDTQHKFFIVTNQGKKVNFGSAKCKDYTIYYKEFGKDIANIKRNAYIARHRKLKEDWNNPNTAGWWSRFLLWEYPTIEEAYSHIQKHLKFIGYL